MEKDSVKFETNLKGLNTLKIRNDHGTSLQYLSVKQVEQLYKQIKESGLIQSECKCKEGCGKPYN